MEKEASQIEFSVDHEDRTIVFYNDHLTLYPHTTFEAGVDLPLNTKVIQIVLDWLYRK